MRYPTRPGEAGGFAPDGHGMPGSPQRPRLKVPPDGLSGSGQLPARGKVLITGGSSGIGAATAQAFSALGFLVAITGSDKAALDQVSGVTGAVAVPGDLREPGRPRQVVEAAAAALEGLDVVISNAGIGWSGSFASMTDHEIDALLDVNLRAAAHVARAALAHLRPGTGHLVFVGSIAGLVGVAEEAWYSATKAGVCMLADALRTELRSEGIQVTLLIPGVVDTPYFDRRKVPYQRQFPRPIAAEVVAAAIVHAVEHRRETVVVPGWLGWPARLKGGFPALYRRLERSLDSGRGSWHGGKRSPVVRPAGPWPRNAGP